ncbi:Rsp5p-dependent ubiquitination, sorting of cargo proteins at the multivesicular body [Boothiomyces macroporosus]|uniref:Rsp5p-dependent ubiquitination, sorting of cargo proteins at the multivesicular body n=1 Tax=Boothiomyces macroporosus TaxID=261099 RepID=A0AAD5UFA4_9FUNG|nr:Rsp5p-dependent ubiquitination, sorting of cargo proteins at the multivesicular body [Boothiomyces macroporosus]
MSTDLSFLSISQYQFNNDEQFLVPYSINGTQYNTQVYTSKNLPVSDSLLAIFTRMLVTNTNATRATDDTNYWTNYPSSITVFADNNENFNQSLSNPNATLLMDSIQLNGDVGITTEKSFFNFSVGGNLPLIKDAVSKWNQSLVAGTSKDIDQQFNQQLSNWIPALNLTSANITGMNGQFTGAVASGNTGGIYNGNFGLININFSLSNIYLNYSLDSSIQFTVSGLSNIYVDQTSHLLFTCNSSIKGPKGAPLAVSLAESIIFTNGGQVNFSGQAGYMVVYKPAKETILSIVVRFAPTVLVSFLMFYWVIKSRRKQMEERRRRIANRMEMTLMNTVTRADAFSSSFPPDSEAAILEMNSHDATPISMSGLDGPTFMCIRQFIGHEFEGIQPSVDIQKMNTESGTQIVGFVTTQECSIQTNACLKPRKFGNDLPQPPPSFDDESVEFNEAYFEARLLEKDSSTKISIGFATCPCPPFRLPGYDYDSVGYHSESGKVYLNDRTKGIQCGPPVNIGDVLGVGYRIIELPKVGDHILNQTVFYFTHNGTRIGDECVADGFYPDKIYPTVGCTGNCKLELIFGDSSKVFAPPTKFSLPQSSLQEVQIAIDANGPTLQTEAAQVPDSQVSEEHEIE